MDRPGCQARGDYFTPVRWERGIDYWKKLHEVIDSEPPYEAYHTSYGQLATQH